MKMYLDLPQFRHLQWIVNRPAPVHDLAWSNILPDWQGVIEGNNAPELISASDPEGDRGFREHLAARYGVDSSMVVLTNGCSEANFLGCFSALRKGSKVLVEKPVYTPLLELPRSMGCEVSTIKRRPDSYRFDLKELDEKLETIQPDLFIFQNLNNPTGKALFGDDLKDLARVLGSHGTIVLVDEVYRDFAMSVTDGRLENAFPSMVELYDRAMISSSVTKVYGAGGLMAGWLVGPRRLMNRARRQKLYTVPMVSHTGNRTALEILRKRDKVMPGCLSDIREKLNLVSLWAKGRSDVHWSDPDGCAVGFLRYDHEIPSIDACERLYKDHGVRVIPGEFFHLEKGFRMSVSKPYDIVKGALTKIDRFFDSL
ncbi:MAG: pyridoxal phosphate-dependent aminotransferase [Candidatus Thermoplasmatota archaeon]|nr:pyridoxal phosphate-dependent aminotransferase [Candidatus Thermoplasmatota archaeon]